MNTTVARRAQRGGAIGYGYKARFSGMLGIRAREGREARRVSPYSYYDRLTSRQKATYRRSDEVTEVALRDLDGLRRMADGVRAALGSDRPAVVQASLQRLCDALVKDLRVSPVEVRVLAKRPRRHASELHGLYVKAPGALAVISVWMRTAQHKKVVTYRTFLRTFLHEVGHHLDLEKLRLPDTFHTGGFFKRESSLVRQLVPRQVKAPAMRAREHGEAAGRGSRMKGDRAAPPKRGKTGTTKQQGLSMATPPARPDTGRPAMQARDRPPAPAGQQLSLFER